MSKEKKIQEDKRERLINELFKKPAVVIAGDYNIPNHNAAIIPEGATNKDIFKAIFGYEPATGAVVCNKEDRCGASEPCNYCMCNPNNIGREEDWWNAPYKESEDV